MACISRETRVAQLLISRLRLVYSPKSRVGNARNLLEIELVKVETRPGMEAWPEEATRDSSLGGPVIRIVNK